MTTYSEKLKDPRWQKMRLKILERDEWACRNCENKEDTLHVHHTYYESGVDPWDYPHGSLVTYCEECHEEERTLRKTEESFLLAVLRERNYSFGDLNEISHAIYENNIDYLCKFFKGRINAKD